MSTQMRRWTQLLAVALWSGGCAHLPHPAPPVLTPPSTAPSPKPTESFVRIPVAFELPPLSTCEELVPCHYGPIEEKFVVDPFIPARASWEGWRTPLEIGLSGDTITASARTYSMLQGAIGPVEGQCGFNEEPPIEFDVRLAMKIGWGSDWSVKTITTGIAEKPPSGPECIVTIQKRNITDRLKEFVNRALISAASKIDGIIAKKTQFRPVANTIWSTIAAPQRISEGVWFQPGLRSAGATLTFMPTGNPDLYEGHGVLEMRGFPTIEFADTPSAPAPLPALQNSTVGNEGLELSVRVSSPLSRLQEALDKSLPRTFTLGSFELVIRKGSVRTVQQGLAIHLDMETRVIPPKPEPITGPGSALKRLWNKLKYDIKRCAFDSKGDAYLIGRPMFDASTRELGVPDLAFDLVTRNALLNSTAWVLDTPVEYVLRNELKLSLANELDTVRRQLTLAFNREVPGEVLIYGYVDQVSAGSIYFEPEAVTVDFMASGILKARVLKRLYP